MDGAGFTEVSYFGRNAVVLDSGSVRAVVEDLGGMMPEFSQKRGHGGLNAHWIPDFRDNSGTPWTEEQSAYWKAKLLYILAGDFPCSPNFGPGCTVDGVALPPHGWVANERWRKVSVGLAEAGRVAKVLWRMESPDPRMPLSWEKEDSVVAGQDAYYSTVRIRNTGDAPVAINFSRHNTLGAPFLQDGCRIYLSAKELMVAPSDTEFDDTGRLVPGAVFRGLDKAPLRSGGVADIGLVPGMIGYTDFVTGAVPTSRALGWSCVVNGQSRMAYIAFFPGCAGLPQGEESLGFNDLWMQYGGRNFTPWALHEGGADRTFCLGTENATGAFANGLAWAREHPEILGRATMLTVPARGERTIRYGVALVGLDPELAGQDILDIEAEEGALVLETAHATQKVPADATFALARSV